MPDRIIRDELLESERWLSLKDNADRLSYIALILKSDSLGNFTAEPYRLMRLWRDFGVSTLALVQKTLIELSDHDLIRLYEADGKRLLHIPRFNRYSRYLKRIFPLSPWTTDEQKQLLTDNSPSAHSVPAVCAPTSKGKERKGTTSPARSDAGMEVRRGTWQAYSVAFTNRYNQEPPDNVESRSAIKRFCAKIPGNECPGVAAFYVSHNSAFYVSKCHDPKLLAADAAKLRTEWANGHQVTQTQAMQADKRQANHSVFTKLIDEAENARRKS